MDGAPIVRKLSEHLGDQEPEHEYVAWSFNLLAWDIYLATLAAIDSEPDKFSRPVEVELAPGETIHNFCDVCNRFGGIISINGVGCSGDIEIISGRHSDAMAAYNLVWNCDKAEGGEWTPGNISFLESSPCTVCFENPTPEDGPPIIITIACVESPDIDCTDENCVLTLPDSAEQALPIIWKYALHLAYDAENESIVSTAKSKQHHNDIILWVKNIFPIKQDFLDDTNLTELSDD